MSEEITKKIIDIAERIEDSMSDGQNIKVTIAKDRYNPVINKFVLMFYESFILTFDEYKLTMTDIKVIFKIMSYAQYGNLISFSQTKLAEDLKIKRPNVTSSIKRLKNAGLIIDDEGNLYLNPQVISKGSSSKMEKDNSELLEKGAEILKEKIGQITPNIATKKMIDNKKQSNN